MVGVNGETSVTEVFRDTSVPFWKLVQVAHVE